MSIEGCAVDGRPSRNVVHGNGVDVSLFVEQVIKALYKQLTGSDYTGVIGIYRHAKPRFLRILETDKTAILLGTQRKWLFVDCSKEPILLIFSYAVYGCTKTYCKQIFGKGKDEGNMIIVTGANGKLGRGVVEQLLQRIPAEQIGVSVRDVNKAQDLEDRGVRVRHGDFDDEESLLYAFEGVSQVLLVSSGILGEAGIRQHQTAIHTARKAGAGRVLYTSHMGSSSTSFFSPMILHAATEVLLKESGIPYTSLRNGFYASSLVGLIGEAIKTGEWIVPEDGPVAWTAHSDLAQGAAVLLTKQSWDGPSPNLTASEAIDMEGVAAMVSDIVGRPIYRKVVTDQAYREYLTAQGFPEARMEITMGLFRASRNGDFAHTSRSLADLIGRPPMRLSDFLKVSLSGSEGGF